MDNDIVPTANVPPVSLEASLNTPVNLPKPNRTPIFVGSAVLVLALIIGTWFFIGANKRSPNPCLTEDSSKSAEDNVITVVRAFEEYQSVKDGKALSACKAASFTSNLMSQSDPFPFYGITTYLVGDPVPISEQKFSVSVNERRMLFSGGVSGGTYPEQDIGATFIVKKDDSGKWAVDSYNKTNSVIPAGGTSVVPADWRTYRNDKYGFEFKYPVSWEIKNNSEIAVKIVDSFQTDGPPNSDQPRDLIEVAIIQSVCKEQEWIDDIGGVWWGRACISSGHLLAQLTFIATSESSKILEEKISSTFKFTE
ncbi:MAG: hypothetical protein A3C06_02565 [Candidatus Taylorbacteria bacterium RIFCSPHIGHO2_02_FULL_46_13]|uniref:Uncharacterized protein n=1 Tax=Candidatus Taylorbacteria bacterium RIFCSPHIGHO2_02_FULL_46_13 TaxID=1802312 RepID=A0A1G2MRF9_9BACT|nr:MAG: hypothetical protein A3C06_02565 [Candidatus Taylorbacteria bacterium RIFCSPHIGHO2_02_FULL_46_13]